MPVLVRNNRPGPTCFSDLATKVTVQWERHGDPDGGDYQQVPEDIAGNFQFLTMVRKGVFEVLRTQDQQGVEDILAGLGISQQMPTEDAALAALEPREETRALITVSTDEIASEAGVRQHIEQIQGGH